MNKQIGRGGSGRLCNKNLGQRVTPAAATPVIRTKVLGAPQRIGWSGSGSASPNPAPAAKPASPKGTPGFIRFARLWTKGKQTLDAWRANGVPEPTRKLIESRARRFARAYGLSKDQAEDLKQDLFYEVWAAIEGYEEGRSTPEAFAAGVICLHYKYLVREHYRKKGRGFEHIPLLDMLIEAPEQFAQLYGEQRAADLRLDIETVLEQLPEELRELAEALMSKTPAEIGECIDMHRGTIYRWIKTLRDEFGEKFQEIR